MRGIPYYQIETPGGMRALASLEATQGQIDGDLSQLPYKCHQNRVASVGECAGDLQGG